MSNPGQMLTTKRVLIDDLDAELDKVYRKYSGHHDVIVKISQPVDGLLLWGENDSDVNQLINGCKKRKTARESDAKSVKVESKSTKNVTKSVKDEPKVTVADVNKVSARATRVETRSNKKVDSTKQNPVASSSHLEASTSRIENANSSVADSANQSHDNESRESEESTSQAVALSTGSINPNANESNIAANLASPNEGGAFFIESTNPNVNELNNSEESTSPNEVGAASIESADLNENGSSNSRESASPNEDGASSVELINPNSNESSNSEESASPNEIGAASVESTNPNENGYSNSGEVASPNEDGVSSVEDRVEALIGNDDEQVNGRENEIGSNQNNALSTESSQSNSVNEHESEDQNETDSESDTEIESGSESEGDESASFDNDDDYDETDDDGSTTEVDSANESENEEEVAEANESNMAESSSSQNQEESEHRCNSRVCWACTKCGVCFLRSQKYWRHIRRTMIRRKQVDECSSCNMTFESECELFIHAQTEHRTHLRKQCKSCERCKNGSFQHSYLQVQQNNGKQANNKKESFQCPNCENVYVREYFYRQHLAICPTGHSAMTQQPTTSQGVRNVPQPFIEELTCNRCRSSFKNRASLLAHQTIKTRYKKLRQCHDCGEKFRGICRLREHCLVEHRRTTRSPSKPNWQCVKCNKQFKRKKDMKTHMMRCNGDEDDTNRPSQHATSSSAISIQSNQSPQVNSQASQTQPDQSNNPMAAIPADSGFRFVPQNSVMRNESPEAYRQPIGSNQLEENPIVYGSGFPNQLNNQMAENSFDYDDAAFSPDDAFSDHEADLGLPRNHVLFEDDFSESDEIPFQPNQQANSRNFIPENGPSQLNQNGQYSIPVQVNQVNSGMSRIQLVTTPMQSILPVQMQNCSYIPIFQTGGTIIPGPNGLINPSTIQIRPPLGAFQIVRQQPTMHSNSNFSLVNSPSTPIHIIQQGNQPMTINQVAMQPSNQPMPMNQASMQQPSNRPMTVNQITMPANQAMTLNQLQIRQSNPMTANQVPMQQLNQPMTVNQVPMQQLNQPIRTHQFPMQQLNQPIRVHQVPMQQLNQPIRAHQVPMQQLNQPMTVNQVPMQQLNQPIRAHQAPMQQLNQPIRVHQVPMQQLNQPMRAPQVPMQQPNQPMTVNQVPMQQLNQPMRAPQVPMQQLNQPMTVNQVPMQQLNQPMRAHQIPMQQLNQPIIANQVPMQQLNQPIRAHQVPIQQLNQPIIANQVPMQQLNQPMLMNQSSIQPSNQAPLNQVPTREISVNCMQNMPRNLPVINRLPPFVRFAHPITRGNDIPTRFIPNGPDNKVVFANHLQEIRALQQQAPLQVNQQNQSIPVNYVNGGIAVGNQMSQPAAMFQHGSQFNGHIPPNYLPKREETIARPIANSQSTNQLQNNQRNMPTNSLSSQQASTSNQNLSNDNNLVDNHNQTLISIQPHESVTIDELRVQANAANYRQNGDSIAINALPNSQNAGNQFSPRTIQVEANLPPTARPVLTLEINEDRALIENNSDDTNQPNELNSVYHFPNNDFIITRNQLNDILSRSSEFVNIVLNDNNNSLIPDTLPVPRNAREASFLRLAQELARHVLQRHFNNRLVDNQIGQLNQINEPVALNVSRAQSVAENHPSTNNASVNLASADNNSLPMPNQNSQPALREIQNLPTNQDYRQNNGLPESNPSFRRYSNEVLIEDIPETENGLPAISRPTNSFSNNQPNNSPASTSSSRSAPLVVENPSLLNNNNNFPINQNNQPSASIVNQNNQPSNDPNNNNNNFPINQNNQPSASFANQNNQPSNDPNNNNLSISSQRVYQLPPLNDSMHTNSIPPERAYYPNNNNNYLNGEMNQAEGGLSARPMMSPPLQPNMLPLPNNPPEPNYPSISMSQSSPSNGYSREQHSSYAAENAYRGNQAPAEPSSSHSYNNNGNYLNVPFSMPQQSSSSPLHYTQL